VTGDALIQVLENYWPELVESSSECPKATGEIGTSAARWKPADLRITDFLQMDYRFINRQKLVTSRVKRF